MQRVRRAALAPAQPSAQDRQLAAEAQRAGREAGAKLDRSSSQDKPSKPAPAAEQQGGNRQQATKRKPGQANPATAKAAGPVRLVNRLPLSPAQQLDQTYRADHGPMGRSLDRLARAWSGGQSRADGVLTLQSVSSSSRRARLAILRPHSTRRQRGRQRWPWACSRTSACGVTAG